MPITRPRSSTAALPPRRRWTARAPARGPACTTQKAEKRRTAWSVLVACSEVAVLVEADGAGDRADRGVARGTSVGGRPRPVALETHDRQAGVDRGPPGGRTRSARRARRRLDPQRVEHHVADRHRVPARSNTIPVANRRAPRRADDGRVVGTHVQADERRRHALHVRGQGRQVVGLRPRLPHDRHGRRQDGHEQERQDGERQTTRHRGPMVSSRPYCRVIVRAELAGLERTPRTRRGRDTSAPWFPARRRRGSGASSRAARAWCSPARSDGRGRVDRSPAG